MSGWRRFRRSLVNNYLRRVHKPITMASLFWASITVAALSVVAINPQGKFGDPLFHYGLWPSALKEYWPLIAIIAACTLKFTDRLRDGRKESSRNRELATTRHLTLSTAIVSLTDQIEMRRPADTGKIDSIRKDLLTCISCRVEQLLQGESSDDKIVVTLLDFSTGKTDMLTVVARTVSTRDTAINYGRKNSVAFESIEIAGVCVCDDVKNDARFANLLPRPYESVMGIPISRKGKAFGAVAIDSQRVYAFLGHASEIAVEVEQYLALLSMTYPDDATTVQCTYDVKKQSLVK